jgi:hypothetical protein
MAYCLASDIVEYGAHTSSDDDVLLGRLITRSQAIIESYTGLVFEGDSDSVATRYFGSAEDTDGLWLFLDKPLAAITSITTGETALSASDYFTEPRNDTPYFSISLRANSSVSWGDPSSDGNYEDNIAVAGNWCYSLTPPADIVHACIRLTRWLYQQRDTDIDSQRPLLTGDGVVIMPSQLPKDVLDILNEYYPGVTL